MGALTFTADIDLTKIDAKIRHLDNQIAKLAKQASNSGAALDSSFNSAGKSASLLGDNVSSLEKRLLGLASVATIGKIGQQIINIRGEFQQLGIAFEVMLNSKEKADKLMQDAILFAQKTPFTLTDVASNIKQLMAMGIETNKVMNTMKALGDVAAGVSVPISRIAINYGQVATLGKLQSRELRDFAMAGIPLMDELAKNMGKTKSEITDMVEAGNIGFPDVEKAFQTMAGEGGKFYNLMEKQNKSVTGQISNLTDKIQVMMNEIGKSNEGLFYGGISGLSTLVANYQDILKTLEALIVTYGIYRTALMLTTAQEKIALVTTMAQEWLTMGRALGFATANQVLFNSALLANPVVAAIAGITALIAVIQIFGEKAKTAEDYIKDLNDSMADIGKQIEIETAVQKFEQLSDKVNRTKEEQDEFNKTVQKLAIIFPDAITETDKYGKAVGLATDKLMAQNKELRDNLILVSQKKGQDAQAELNKLLLEQKNLQDDINKGQRVTTINNPRAGAPYQITTIFTKEQITEKRTQLATLAQSIAQFGATIDQENQKILQLKTIEANQILSGYSNLFAEVTSFTKQQAIDAKQELLKIATPDGSIAQDLVKDQINALDAYINKFKTNSQQEKEWTDQLTQARAKYKKMQEPNYESTDIAKEKSDQLALIKSLEEKLGIKHEEKKAVDELKKAQEDLDKAVKKGDQASIDALGKKVALLQKEADLRKYIADEAIAFGKGEVTQAERDAIKKNNPIKPILDKSIVQVGTVKKVNGIAYELTAIDKTGPTWKKMGLEVGKLNKLQKEGIKDAEKLQDEIDKKAFEKRKQNQEDLLNYARQFTSELIDQLGLTEKESKVLNSLADTVFNISSGNLLGAAFSGASMLLSVLSGKGKTDPTTKALEHVNELLERQSALLANLAGTNYFQLAAKQYDDLGKSIDLNNKKLQQSNIHTREEYEQAQRFFNQQRKDFPNGPIAQIGFDKYLKGLKSVTDAWNPQDFIDAYTAGTIALDKEQLDWIKGILDSQKQRAELLQDTFREALGFDSNDVSQSIFEGIDQGLKLSENGLGGFAQSFGDLMKKALMQSITDSMNADITNTFLPKYKEYMSDGILTESERSDLELLYSTLVRKGQIDNENINKITSQYTSSSTSPSQMTGSVQGATEETVGALVGQTMAMRVDMKSMLEIQTNQLELMDKGLSVLQNIERNTKGISRLEDVYSGIQETNKLLKAKL